IYRKYRLYGGTEFIGVPVILYLIEWIITSVGNGASPPPIRIARRKSHRCGAKRQVPKTARRNTRITRVDQHSAQVQLQQRCFGEVHVDIASEIIAFKIEVRVIVGQVFYLIGSYLIIK